MSVSYIPDAVKFRLWGRAAGRCEYEGCNTELWRDSLTKAEFNTAYVAHIYADSKEGPRYQRGLSENLAQDISNLMLLCDEHHRLIDKAAVAQYPAARLFAMKAAHEDRIELLGGLGPELRSEVILYGANIGAYDAPLSFKSAANAILPRRYPASAKGITLGVRHSLAMDRDAAFWAGEKEQLLRAFDRTVKPLIAQDAPHLSVFAVAPQPLLVMFGSLLNDLNNAEVYQLHREPFLTWSWDDEGADSGKFEIIINPPSERRTKVAAVFSISATIAPERVHAVLGSDVSIWSFAVEQPHNDALRKRSQLSTFRAKCRELLAAINMAHPGLDCVHVFPAMPVAAAVELGRAHMPKADPPLRVYDEQRHAGGFIEALLIPVR